MGSTPGTALNCAIIGAGVAGLAAGISLRKSGHEVTIFEKSGFVSEIGAAITITPNGNRVLSHWKEWDAEAAGETHKVQSRFVDPETLELVSREGFEGLRERYGASFNAFHRVDLHQALRRIAEGLGAKIVLGKEVVGLDCENGALEFRDGEKGTWDLVVVADGIKGAFINQISGIEAPLFRTGRSLFRGLVPVEALLQDPLVRPLFENQASGFCATVSKSGIFVMTYPCRNDSVMNFAVIHDTRVGHEDNEGWNSPASLQEVLEVMEGLHPAWKALVSHAKDSIKCFPIMLRGALPRYNRGRAVLIGDAAHSMQPTHAQGGAMGLEDAATLEIFFPGGFDKEKESVAKRLQLFNDFRLPRDNTTQLYSNVQMPRDANEKAKKMQEHLANIRKFYSGPLMPMESAFMGRERQDFFYWYDVFEQARLAMKVKDREAGLMQDEVKHFY